MKQLKIRYITQEDQKTFLEWVNTTAQNLYDPDILKYPTLKVLCSYNGHPVAYMPFQQTLMLESLAVKPNVSPIETGQAFRDLVKGAELHASGLGIKEMYMACKDYRVIKVAEAHGFDILSDKDENGKTRFDANGNVLGLWPVLRMRL